MDDSRPIGPGQCCSMCGMDYGEHAADCSFKPKPRVMDDFAKRLPEFLDRVEAACDYMPPWAAVDVRRLIEWSREQLERPTLDVTGWNCWTPPALGGDYSATESHLHPSADRQLREENERLRKALGMSDDDKLISSSPDGTFIREDRVGNRTRVNLMAEEYRELVQLRQENERLRAATEWKPIAEALKDGTEYQGGWFGMSGCYYSGTPICWQRTDGREGWFLLSPTGEQANKDWYPCPWLKQIDYPTHFRPLPAPPTEAEKGSERK